MKQELREEFMAALKAQAELLTTGGVGRHEKALIRIDGVEKEINTKIAAIEKAANAFETNLNRVPTNLDREAGRLQELFTEKLSTISAEIKCFATFADAMRAASKEAVYQMFEAAKEITANQRQAFESQLLKSDSSFTKEIDSLKTLRVTDKEAISADLANLTGRMDRGEGGDSGTHRAIANNRSNIAVIAAMASAAFLALSVFHVPATTAGSDTKRVDDLITLITEQNRQSNARIDALSARLTALPPSLTGITPR